MKLTTRETVGILMFFGGLFMNVSFFVMSQNTEPGVRYIFMSLAFGGGFLVMISGLRVGTHREGKIYSALAAGIVFTSFIVSAGYFGGREQWMLGGVVGILGTVIFGCLAMVSRSRDL